MAWPVTFIISIFDVQPAFICTEKSAWLSQRNDLQALVSLGCVPKSPLLYSFRLGGWKCPRQFQLSQTSLISWYSNTNRIWRLLLKVIGEQDPGKILRRRNYLLPWQPHFPTSKILKVMTWLWRHMTSYHSYKIEIKQALFELWIVKISPR